MEQAVVASSTPRALELSQLMAIISRASSFEELQRSVLRARRLGLMLRGDYFLRGRSFHQSDISLLASAQSEEQLADILLELNTRTFLEG